MLESLEIEYCEDAMFDIRGAQANELHKECMQEALQYKII
jgi:hypothetical protein